jgi:2-polyprenyl-3-methyl-5-hydroxy-6-metoxy-1,4-benzoquinol methylase
MLKIYNQYQEYGVEGYYKQHSSTYFNPHQEKIITIYKKHIVTHIPRNGIILDIACGDGLMEKIINSVNINTNVEGTDPFFKNNYCKYNFSFEDIALGKLEKEYDVITCCYAFHLINDNWKYNFLSQLARMTKKFIIISPSKKITINNPLWKITKEIREDKVTIIILETQF